MPSQFKCCVENCVGTKKKFRVLDRDKVKWCENLQIDQSQVNTTFRICALHFKPSVIGATRLKKGAMPTINLGHNGPVLHLDEDKVEIQEKVENGEEGENKESLEHLNIKVENEEGNEESLSGSNINKYLLLKLHTDVCTQTEFDDTQLACEECKRFADASKNWKIKYYLQQSEIMSLKEKIKNLESEKKQLSDRYIKIKEHIKEAIKNDEN